MKPARPFEETRRVATFEQVEGYRLGPAGELIIPPPMQPDQDGIDTDSEELWAKALGGAMEFNERPDFVGPILDQWEFASRWEREDTRPDAPA